ncbi:MAG: hypothetical protein EOO88_29595 [Pedobacter sp.]|nr:MAG: hypothetical protein EOO88_29595 [Pedobacter sp.]
MLKPLISLLTIIILGCPQAISQSNAAKDSIYSKVDPVLERLVVVQPAPYRVFDDIYFGKPYQNNQVARRTNLGDCEFEFRDFTNTSYGKLASFQLFNDTNCPDEAYFVRLFTDKYGIADSSYTKSVAEKLPVKSVSQLLSEDNSYSALMLGANVYGVFEKPVIILVVDSTTEILQAEELVGQWKYTWRSQRIEICLSVVFMMYPVPSGRMYEVHGPKSNANYRCESVERFANRKVTKLTFTDIVAEELDDKIIQYRESKRRQEREKSDRLII